MFRRRCTPKGQEHWLQLRLRRASGSPRIYTYAHKTNNQETSSCSCARGFGASTTLGASGVICSIAGGVGAAKARRGVLTYRQTG